MQAIYDIIRQYKRGRFSDRRGRIFEQIPGTAADEKCAEKPGMRKDRAGMRLEVKIEIKEFTKDRIEDVVRYEKALRAEEDFYGWEIDDAYICAVRNTFEDSRFANALSLLAYADGQVAGRIDTSLIASRFDGTLNAYLDWICVIKSYRHAGIAQMLLREARMRLKAQGAEKLIALMAANDEAQRFYRAVENAQIHDEGIWMEL